MLFRLNRQRAPCTNLITPLWRPITTSGTLYLLGVLKSETPALYATWLVTGGAITPLWASIVPAIDPTFAFELAGAFPSAGTIGIYSVLVTSTLDVCTSWETTATAGGGTPR